MLIHSYNKERNIYSIFYKIYAWLIIYYTSTVWMNNTICHNRENEFVNFCCTDTSISKNESVPCTNQQIHFRRRMKKKR